MRGERLPSEVARREQMILLAEEKMPGSGDRLKYTMDQIEAEEQVVLALLRHELGKHPYISAEFQFHCEDYVAWRLSEAATASNWPKPDEEGAPYSRAFILSWFAKHYEEEDGEEEDETTTMCPLSDRVMHMARFIEMRESARQRGIWDAERLEDAVDDAMNYIVIYHAHREKTWGDTLRVCQRRMDRQSDNPQEQLNQLLNVARNGIPPLQLSQEERRTAVEPHARKVVRDIAMHFLSQRDLDIQERMRKVREIMAQGPSEWEEILSHEARKEVIVDVYRNYEVGNIDEGEKIAALLNDNTIRLQDE
ncbi:hypothetical protein F5Y16DRAFT_398332 [Xylariaceae sp. FL0255]|nr:hypothetical protein F5Y16DRAFT_398332 [Xylariaceae sp. FL0255]